MKTEVLFLEKQNPQWSTIIENINDECEELLYSIETPNCLAIVYKTYDTTKVKIVFSKSVENDTKYITDIFRQILENI